MPNDYYPLANFETGAPFRAAAAARNVFGKLNGCLNLIAASEHNRIANVCAISLLELQKNQRISTRSALHRLLRNRQRSSIDEDVYIRSGLCGVRASDVVTKDETRFEA
jgi:hypothetical protein